MWSCCGHFALIIPVRSQPKPVLRANRYPGGDCCWPWHMIWLYMSAPSRMSMWSGTPKSGSARQNPDRYFHFWLNGTGKVGSFVITFGRTAASNLYHCPETLPVFNDFWFVKVNDTIKRDDNPCFSLPIPVPWTSWQLCGSDRGYAKCSVTNKVDDVQSSKVLALVIRLSDITTTTRYTIRSMVHLALGSRYDKRELWHVKELTTSASNVCILPQSTLLLALATMLQSNCRCSKVWCGFWHFG